MRRIAFPLVLAGTFALAALGAHAIGTDPARVVDVRDASHDDGTPSPEPAETPERAETPEPAETPSAPDATETPDGPDDSDGRDDDDSGPGGGDDEDDDGRSGSNSGRG